MISRRSRTVLLLFVAIFIALVPVVSVFADKTIFYPSVCDGDWRKPEEATKSFSVEKSDDIDSSNSAESNGVGSRIVCSHFSDAALSDLRPISVKLELSLRPIGEGNTEASSTISRLLSDVTAHAFADEITPLGLEGGVSQVAITEPISTTQENAVENVTPSVVDQSTATTSTVEEVIVHEVSTTSIDAVSTSTPDEHFVPVEEIKEATSTEVGLATTTVEGQIASHPDIEAQISFDEGASWNFIGAATITKPERLTFDVPLSHFETGEDLSRVSIRVIKTAGTSEVLFDSSALSIGFANLEGDARSVVTRNLEYMTPDLANNTIVSMINLSRYSIMGTTDSSGSGSLWVYDDQASPATSTFRIASSTTFSTGFSVAIKDGIIFWLTDSKTVYGFRLSDGRFLIPLSHDVLETGEVNFSFFETKWKVISRGGSIFFSTLESGELAGDDDGVLRESFYHKNIEPNLTVEAKTDMERFGVTDDTVPPER
jgi:hypothetical protein